MKATQEEIQKWANIPGAKLGPKANPELMKAYQDLVLESSRIVQDGPEPKKARKLIEPSFEAPATWFVPVYTYAGDNAGSRQRGKRIGRAGHERWAVHEVMARWDGLHVFAEGIRKIQIIEEQLVVRLTRLGPRRLDDDNLGAALKYVRDAIAERFGVDDGDSRWSWSYAQELNPAYGVRIEIE